jgi:general secretion pathway protein E
MAHSQPVQLALGSADGTRAGFAAHLVASDGLSAVALERADRLAAENGETLGLVLTRLGLIAERDLAEALARYLDLPLVGPKDFPDAPVLEGRFNRRFLKEARLIPLARHKEGLAVAMADPFDDAAAEAIRFAADEPVLRRVATLADIDAAWERLYGDGIRRSAL